MSADLISRSALLDKSYCPSRPTWDNPYAGGEVVDVEDIENAPSIDAKPVIHAYWVDDPAYKEPRKNGKYPYCSSCVTTACTKHIYCPHCGAKMDGKKPDEVVSV